jgi:hypothetical protein
VQDNQEVEEWFDEHDLLRDDNKIAREARHDRYRCRRDERLAEEPHVTPMSLTQYADFLTSRRPTSAAPPKLNSSTTIEPDLQYRQDLAEERRRGRFVDRPRQTHGRVS